MAQSPLTHTFCTHYHKYLLSVPLSFGIFESQTPTTRGRKKNNQRTLFRIVFTFNAWVMCCNLCSLPQMPNENWYNQNTCPEWSGCFDNAAKVYPNKMFCLSDPGIEALRKRTKKEEWSGEKKNNRVQINVWTDPIKCYLGMRIMCMLPGSFVTRTKTKKKIESHIIGVNKRLMLTITLETKKWTAMQTFYGTEFERARLT